MTTSIVTAALFGIIAYAILTIVTLPAIVPVSGLVVAAATLGAFVGSKA